MRSRLISLAVGVALLAGLGVWAALGPESEKEIGGYVTSLDGRTDSQIYNAALAVKEIDNTVVRPGEVFSFLKAVGPWTADRGYKKAPVSYDGELVESWGGGVCQASSTLYNAVLLSGLEIVERHRHYWPARYAPLGRDAAVAYYDIDLRFKNNLPEPIRIIGKIEGNKLIFSITSVYHPDCEVRVDTEMLSVVRPGEVVRDFTVDGSGHRDVVNKGQPGFKVATYRTFTYEDSTRRELVDTDSYPAMNRVIRVADRQ